jgi:dodecin
MSGQVYKHIDLTGSSATSSDDAVRIALAKAAHSVRGMHWFEVLETRGKIKDGVVAQWQVTVRVGFELEG